jgi:membrane protein required for beta-lactamase induction
MTWLALVLALFLEQMSFPALRARLDAASVAWPRRVVDWIRQGHKSDGQRWLGLAAALLLPAVAVSAVHSLLGDFFGWFWMLLVFYAALAFSRYLRSASLLREAVEWRDEAMLAQVVATQVPQAQEVRGGPAAQALAVVLMLAQRQVLGVLAAVVVGWLLGAPLFVLMVWLMAQHWQAAWAASAEPSEAATGSVLVQAMETAGVMLTALVLAVSGQFDAVLRAWRGGVAGAPRGPMLRLADAAAAVLDLPEAWMTQARAVDDPEAVNVDHLMRWDAWVWRVMGVWLLVFAVLTMLSW